MEPEEDFLDNAVIMLRYSRKEIKQFLAWTRNQERYKQLGEEILRKLDTVAAQVDQLQKEYKEHK